MKSIIARTVLLAACVTATATVATLAAQSVQHPETVMLTLQPREGAESALATALADHWATATKLNLVKPELHVTLRARDDAGHPYFVDIFTWRDAEIPDAAPAAITAIWERLNALTESRGGRPGLDIKPVVLVAPQ
jgi:hypothetical protein